VRVEPLDDVHLPEVQAFLLRERVPNMFLLDQLALWELGQAPGLRWSLAFTARGALAAVVYANRPALDRPALSLSAAGDPDACYAVGRTLRPLISWMMVGPRQAVDGLWEGLGCPGYRVFYDQRLYCCDRPPEGPALVPEPARPADVPRVAWLQREMLQEDLGLAAGRIDVVNQEQRVRERVEQGRMFVLRDPDGDIVFTIDGGNMGPHGTQVGGTYTVPDARGQGIATRAMRGLCGLLLERVPWVTLHVNEANTAAVRVYERSGFQPVAPFRLMSV
jgi:RimJ/RimL family protein N-acetyltransferase